MFSGGAPGSGPAASGKGLAASDASDGLLVDEVAAIAEVMKPCKRKGRRRCGPECAVHVQCPVLDKEEMLGYLTADVLGLPLLRAPVDQVNEARSVGEAARLRAKKAAPAIEAARRQGKAADLATLRSRVVAELPLPLSSSKPAREPTLAERLAKATAKLKRTRAAAEAAETAVECEKRRQSRLPNVPLPKVITAEAKSAYCAAFKALHQRPGEDYEDTVARFDAEEVADAAKLLLLLA